MKLHVFIHALADCESNVTHGTMICNIAAKTLRSGTTQILVLWILHSMNIYVALYVVHGDEFLNTQNTDI